MTHGVQTFLFADLESSTRLWEEYPQQMPAAIERHDQILRRAVEGANGRVVKTTGDGVMAAFDSACDAVQAALDAQRGLLSEPWTGTAPLRARIGLHSGEAHGRGGDFFGAPVYRAARIMSAGHGGQVLLSRLTAELASGDGLPPGVGLRDLGEHRLKDLLEPEHIFQLTHADLPAELPPLATLSRRAHNLPIQYSELIGRKDELDQLRELLDAGNVRLLTLTGPGGIGKTRLALAAAAEQIDRFADGVVFVDLSGTRERDQALAAIVRAAGLTGQADLPLLQLLRRELAGRELLLVLDNFEQVMPAADAVAELLRNCPRLKILATSREALRVRGEQLFPVPPLELPPPTGGPVTAGAIAGHEAVRLFVERAQAARPDFRLTDDNAAAVFEITVRLDGLPLALELAAARLNLFSAAELAERLRRRLDVLRGGPRDLPARQQTLRDTIEWSYELLSPEERLLFCLLSVFGGARFEAVEQVADRLEQTRRIDALETLSSLVDKSLVRSVLLDDVRRLSMLETIREYAAERLASEPAFAEAARRAHAEYFSELAATTPGELLAAELANLQSAWRHWLAAGDLARLQPLLDSLWVLHEKRGWYGAAVALAAELLELLARLSPSEQRVEEELTLRMSLARGLLAMRGYTDEVEQIYREALARSESIGLLPRRLSVLRSLANFHLYRGELDKTQAMGQQLLDLGLEAGDERLQLEGHFLVGATTAFLGDVPAGQGHLARASEIFDPARHGATRLRLGPSPGVTTRTTSALLHFFTGRLDSAEREADAALRLASEIEHPYSLAYGSFHVGLYNAYSLRFERARQLAEETLRISREHDYAIWNAIALVLLGLCSAHLGQPAEGMALGKRGLELYRVLTTPPIFGPALLSLQADTLSLAGRAEDALELIDESIGLSDPRDLQWPFILVQKGILLSRTGRATEAGEFIRRGANEAVPLGAHTARLVAATALVSLSPAPAEGDVAMLRQTLEQLEEGEQHPLVVAARQVLAATAQRAAQA